MSGTSARNKQSAFWTLPSLFLSSLQLCTSSLWSQPPARPPLLLTSALPLSHLLPSAPHPHGRFCFHLSPSSWALLVSLPLTASLGGSVKLIRAPPDSWGHWAPQTTRRCSAEVKSMDLGPSSVTLSCVTKGISPITLDLSFALCKMESKLYMWRLIIYINKLVSVVLCKYQDEDDDYSALFYYSCLYTLIPDLCLLLTF